MQLIEIIPSRLFQSDAESSVYDRLRERGLTPACVIDLHGGNPPTGTTTDIVYVRWPIEDGPVPHVPTLLSLARLGESVINSGGRVVSMCNMGRNRSGLLSALIVSRCEGITGRESVRYVRSKCPEALANEAFEAFLLDR
jgi:protein-tyrosine phosphatase